MTKELEDFLESRKGAGNRCVVCRHENVSDIIVAHLDLLESGGSLIPLAVVHTGLILPVYGVPKCMETVRTHVRRCLKRDPATGESL